MEDKRGGPQRSPRWGWVHRGLRASDSLRARWFPDFCAGWAFVLPLAVFAAYLGFTAQASYYLDVEAAVDRPVQMQVFFDDGAGPNADHTCILPAGASQDLQVTSFPINVTELHSIRFDPAMGPVKMRVASITVRSSLGERADSTPVYTFDLGTLRPVQQVDELTHDGAEARILVKDDREDDPITAIVLPAPLHLEPDWSREVHRFLAAALGWLVLWLALREAGHWLPAALAAPRWLAAARSRRLPPAGAVWLVASLATVLSCYPVIFCGESFVSPNFEGASPRLYNRFPTLPGTSDERLEYRHSIDVDALSLAHVPYAAVQSRALWRDHELPLWNRYNYCGLPLLGQGQSMFGDPLHLLVLLAGEQSWAWDLKFILAKLLLAAGVGLLVLAATDCLPAALLLAFSSVFLGFFAWRLRHPAYFSLCYAPWILYVWFRIVRAPTWRGAMRWAGGLILANWCELNSGTAKEAYMLLLCLNGCGVLALWLSRRPPRAKALRTAGLLGAGMIFCLLAAPVLLTFFSTLKRSMSVYDVPSVWQLQPSMLIGLFDDIFYRQFKQVEDELDPSANFLVLMGCLLALSSCKRLSRDRIFLAVALSALLPLVLVFGVVPPALLRQTPLLGNIIHVDNTFSCVLLVYLFVLAGFGFKRCLARLDGVRWRLDTTVACLLGGALFCAYLGSAQAAFYSPYSFLQVGHVVERSTFFNCYVPLIGLAALLLPFVLRRLAVRAVDWTAVFLLAGCLFLIHWRTGLQVHSPFDFYTPVLPARQDLLARSPAIDYLRGDHVGVFRTLGLEGTFGEGYGASVGLEDIHGADALFSPPLYELFRAAMGTDESWISDAVTKARLAKERRLYDLLNVRYCLAPAGEDLGAIAGLHRERALDLDVYRNETVWPRAFFVDRLALYERADDFYGQVRDGDGQPFAAIETAEEQAHHDLIKDLEDEQTGRTVVAATKYQLTNHRTSFELRATGPGIVVLTETYLEGEFRATLNKQPVPVLRINHAFKGVFVPRAGFYRVSFDYWPQYLTAALCASGLGLALLLAAAYGLRPRREAGAS